MATAKPPMKSAKFDLIESDRVEGTTVYRSDGTKIGAIERVMIDKYSGQATYAVMSFGGLLGFGHDHYPIPWAKLDYNPELGGYEVNISDSELKNAPHFDPGKEYNWGDPAANQKVYDYYRVGL